MGKNEVQDLTQQAGTEAAKPAVAVVEVEEDAPTAEEVRLLAGDNWVVTTACHAMPCHAIIVVNGVTFPCPTW